MALPTRVVVDDIDKICAFLAGRATGVTLKEAQAIIDGKHLHTAKLSAMKAWGFIEENGEKLKATSIGRDYARGTAADRKKILFRVLQSCSPYSTVVERAAHKGEESISAVDIAAHWHSHFKDEVGQTDEQLNQQAIAFLNIAEGAGLGTLTIGRKGNPTRFIWEKEALTIACNGVSTTSEVEEDLSLGQDEVPPSDQNKNATTPFPNTDGKQLGQAIFLAHGKNKGPLDQLQKILQQFKVPFKIAIDEPNLGRPISAKIREVMQQCNCAILIFTADEKFTNKENEDIWRPSENVIWELGACSYLYENRVVVIKEDKVVFPTNFRDLGYISFSDGGLDAKAMDILKELIGFGIIKIST